MTESIRIGTRGSKLALWQANWVATQLRGLGHAVEIVEIKTQGDTHQAASLADVSQATGTQGLFTKELQRALLDRRIDVAVHSMKDLPTDPIDGLTVAATPPREAAYDMLVGRYPTIDELPQGARIGTGSLRRRAQLLRLRPDLILQDLRGNIDTRLKKLTEGQHDAILLAAAGLKRLGLAADITHVIPVDQMTPAPAQGCLAIECREGDPVAAAVASIDSAEARATVTAERTAMRRLEGGCLAALGAHATIDDGRLRLCVDVLSGDGSRSLQDEFSGNASDAAEIGVQAADDLLTRGAADLLRPRNA